jgi:hypothetical protein
MIFAWYWIPAVRVDDFNQVAAPGCVFEEGKRCLFYNCNRGKLRSQARLCFLASYFFAAQQKP